jgi:quinol monooxygenase YgiN
VSEPIVFISHFKVKEGKLDGLRQFAQATTEQIKADKPGTVVFLQYLNEAGTEQSVIHVFPDADAFDRHSEGAAERAKAALEFIVLTRREVYGTPSDQALAMLRPPEGSGITLTVITSPMSGSIVSRQDD